MQRIYTQFLNQWLNSTERKPLVIRGARQVGKTWIVNDLANLNQKKLVDLNFEKKPQLISLFSSNNPQEIILNLTAIYGPIEPAKSILFLDEIQAAPELFAKLRWFAEDMPELPVIAAGSLLEFSLEKHTFSMPVGRINYMYLEPLSFEEFLLAQNHNLFNYLKIYNFNSHIPITIHEQLLSIFKEYLIVGGMPQAVNSWLINRSLASINQIHNDLIATYRDDFTKYYGRLSIDRLDEVFNSVPLFLGRKFIYSKVNSAVQHTAIKQALELLCKAKICHKTFGSAANGIPIGAELQEKYMKVILLDTGLCSTILGLSLDQLNSLENFDLINKGNISEQVVGQILRTINPAYIEPKLYYWHRDAQGSSAEIDYLLQHQNKIIPIEVKAGTTGSLKSLHIFMDLKELDIALRINADLPTITQINIKDHKSYKLFSIPYYLIGEIHRLLATNI
jgi:hypothetical protein